MYSPNVVKHLAAESHVDRSIVGPTEFIQTNMVGIYVLFESARKYWENAMKSVSGKVNNFRFHHGPTDEVYEDLHETDALSISMVDKGGVLPDLCSNREHSNFVASQ